MESHPSVGLPCPTPWKSVCVKGLFFFFTQKKTKVIWLPDPSHMFADLCGQPKPPETQSVCFTQPLQTVSPPVPNKKRKSKHIESS